MANWIIITNPKYYDIVGAFEKYKKIDYKQSTDIKTGDTVYIYMAHPYQEIKYKCVALKTDLSSREVDTSEFDIDNTNYKDAGRYMTLELQEIYDEYITLEDLQDIGIKSVQGPFKVSERLQKLIDDKVQKGKNEIRQTQVFFVFQNKSYQEESSEGYLWAPKRNDQGHIIAHWDLMRKVKKGDLIIHSFNRRIVAVSKANNDVYSSERPEIKGTHWNNNGWRVDAKYHVLETPIDTINLRDHFRKIQPKKLSPYNIKNRGNTGYLYNANVEMLNYLFEVIRSESIKDYASVSELIRRNDIDFTHAIYDDEQLKQAVAEIIESGDESISTDDDPRPVDKPDYIFENSKKKFKRNGMVAYKALKRANFCCEIDSEHPSFIRRKTKKNYTEPHHLIPMEFQDQFEHSLDVVANIVSLCSNCHNHIHYGEGSTELITKLLQNRKKDLALSGIDISPEDLLILYKIETKGDI